MRIALASIGGLLLLAVAGLGLGQWVFGGRLERMPEFARRARLVLPPAADGRVDVARRIFAFPLEVDPAQVAPIFLDLLLFDEDRAFMEHPGIDVSGLARAVWHGVRGRLEGGSTITQQLIKNLYLSPERTLARKLREIPAALLLERHFDKRRILTAYLATAYFGHDFWGVEAAARGYFRKRAACLSPLEAAMLVRTLKAPSRRNPRTRRAALIREARELLIRRFGPGEARRLLGRRWPVPARCRLRSPWPVPTRFYARDAVFDQFVRMRPAARRDEPVVIYTTIDPELQLYAELAVRRASVERARYGFDQIALVVMTPDGRVRALVGGFDYRRSPWNRALRARRQPGSAIKPLVYLAALEAGWRLGDPLEDTPLEIEGYRPRNIDRRFLGRVTLLDALVLSRNVATVRLAEQVGRRRLVALAHRLGYEGALPDDPTMALGSGETTLLDLVELYATFANGGWPVRGRLVEAVRYYRGGFLDWPGESTVGKARGVSAAALCRLVRALEEVVRRGTGRRAVFAGGHRTAGKTGTSQAYRDAWFVGFTAHLVAGVWIGRDDGAPLDGLIGGDLPARVFARFMVNAHLGRAPQATLAGCPAGRRSRS